MFTVLIPVGPKDAELARLTDTLESLRAHEPAEDIRLVLVDDGPAPRAALSAVDWPTPVTVIRTALWGGPKPPPFKSALVAGAMDGIRAAARGPEGGGDFCLKMDTDALVIAPFADKVRAAFAADPTLGMVGSYDRRCTGEPRDVTHKARVIALAPRRIHVYERRTRLGIPVKAWYKRAPARRRAQELIDRAVGNGYALGMHCLGGAYAISPAMLAQADLLDWSPWVRTWDLGEDVSVSLVVRAAGLGIRGMVDQDEPFGLAFQGLPASPEWLVAHGSSLIHSLKDFEGSIEAELRAWFREHTR